MTELMSAERIAGIKRQFAPGWTMDVHTAQHVLNEVPDLLSEVERLRAALARVADVERLHRAYLEAQLGRPMDDDEYADSRSRAEIGWLRSAVQSVSERD